MNDIRISIICDSNCDAENITSLFAVPIKNFECIVNDNVSENFNKKIINDKRCVVINTNTTKTIYDVINHAHGEYILFLNQSNTLPPNAINDLLHIIDLTNADVIKLKAGNAYDENARLSRFKYIFNKSEIMDYCFEDLSCFCFKKKLVSGVLNFKSWHVFLMNILANAKDMANASKICLIQNNNFSVPTYDYIDIINNYMVIKNNLSDEFWKKYFYNIIPKLVMATAKHNTKQIFLYFINQIPLNFIPLRYRIICYILKKTNK